MDLKKQLQTELDNVKARLEAWKAVEINTKHKSLTNRAVKGAELRPISYSINNSRELVVYYHITSLKSGYKTSEIDTIDASEYTGETVAYIKQSQTITPEQMAKRVAERVAVVQKGVDHLESVLANADEFIRERKQLLAEQANLNERISKFNKTIPLSLWIDRR